MVAASGALECAAVERLVRDSIPWPRLSGGPAPALPDALPWNRLSPSEHAPAISLDAVVRPSKDGLDRRNHGTLITYVRLDWEGFSANRPTYRALVQALDRLVPNLPWGNGTTHAPVDLPLDRLNPSALAKTIEEEIGFAKVAITAAMLLDTPVALVATTPLLTPQLLQIIDAVTALLPYGYRAGLEVRAWTQAAGKATGYLLSYATSAHRGVRELNWDQTCPLLAGSSSDASEYHQLLLRMKQQDKVTEGIEYLAALARPCGLDLPRLALDALWRVDRWALSPQHGAFTADAARIPSKLTKLRWPRVAAPIAQLKHAVLKSPRITTAPGDLAPTPLEELDLSELAKTIEEEIGFAKVAITAAMLLDSPVALISAAPLSAQPRKIIDAVTALLPYGYRAGLRTGTWAQASRGLRAPKSMKGHLAPEQRGGPAGGGQDPPEGRLWLGYAVSAHRDMRVLHWDQEHPMLAGCSPPAREYLRLLLRMQARHDVAEIIAHLSIQAMPHGLDLPRLALTLQRMDQPSLSSSSTLVASAEIYKRVETHAYHGGRKTAIAAFSSFTADTKLDRTLQPLEKLLLKDGEISCDDLALVGQLGPQYVRLLVEIGCWSDLGDAVLPPIWEWLVQAAPLTGSENAAWWATLVALRDSLKETGRNRARLDLLALMVSRRPLRPLPQTLSNANADEYLTEFDEVFWDPLLDGRCREGLTTRLAECLKGKVWTRSDRAALGVLALLRSAVTSPHGRGGRELAIPDEVLDVVAGGLEQTPDLHRSQDWDWWAEKLRQLKPRADPIEEAAATFAEALKRSRVERDAVGRILRSSVAPGRLCTAEDVEWFLAYLRTVLPQTRVGIGSADTDAIYYGVIDAILDNWLGVDLAGSYRRHLEATAPEELDRWARRLDLVLEFLTEEERRELRGRVAALIQPQKRTGLRRWLHR